MKEDYIHRDRELFHRIAKGDEEAFREIFHEYNARLFNAVLKLVKLQAEAEEIIQDTFLKLWLRREHLPSLDNPVAWLHTVASNLALDALRKQARQYRKLAALRDLVEEGSMSGPEDELEGKEIQLLIKQAVDQLPAARKEVYLLSRGRGLDRKSIALQLNISESTVKNQLNAALKSIQQHIEEKGNIYLPALVILCVS